MLKDPEVLERATNALLSSSEYQRGSSLPPFPLFPPSPSLSDSDEEALQDLHHQLQRLGKQAKAAGVRIDIDAEQTVGSFCVDSIPLIGRLVLSTCNRSLLLSPRQRIQPQSLPTYHLQHHPMLSSRLDQCSRSCTATCPIFWLWLWRQTS